MISYSPLAVTTALSRLVFNISTTKVYGFNDFLATSGGYDYAERLIELSSWISYRCSTVTTALKHTALT